MRVGIVHDPIFLKHLPDGQHPENPTRLEAVLARLQHDQLLPRLRSIPVRPATDEELLRVHTPELLAHLQATEGAASSRLDSDTYACPDSLTVARHASGALIEGVEALLADELDTLFALIRPPGHHAERNRAMGFCLINHIAVAAAHALQRGTARVAIVDWDVHHGNGTQEIFYDSSRVLYISTHQYPLFPGTGLAHEIGESAGKFHTLNLPLPAGLPEEELVAVYGNIVLPSLKRFAPELILVSAGFDAHRDDPLAQMLMTASGFAQLTRLIESLRLEQPRLKTLYALEGGYNPTALAESVSAVIRLLADEQI